VSAGKNSHREIERKFLVRTLPEKLDRFPHTEIAQGYLAIAPEGVQVRLRKRDKMHCLAYKRNFGVAREEREIELSLKQFEALWPATHGKRLTKTRYDVAVGDRVIEIDVYRGEHDGLIVAEVEFDDEQSARDFQPPDWLGDDVTLDPRYSNQLLAS
jgi:CYTH domain-containing protein